MRQKWTAGSAIAIVLAFSSYLMGQTAIDAVGKADVAVVLHATPRAEKHCQPDAIRSVLSDTTAYLTAKGLTLGTVANSDITLALVVDRPRSKWIEITVQGQDRNGTVLWSEKVGDGSWAHLGGIATTNTLEKVFHLIDGHLKLQEPTATSVQQSKVHAATPTQPGTYYQSSTGFVRMERVSSSGFKSSGKAKSTLTNGISGVTGSFTYATPNALTRVIDHKPTFLLVSQAESSVQQVVLIKLDKKKDHREMEFVKASVLSGTTTEDKNAIPLSVTRTLTGNIVITPIADLPAGEYLLTTDLSKGYTGYDFGLN